MNDVKGFCKLMDISVPDYEHFDYYIHQLSKTERWKNIYDLIKLFEYGESKYGDLYEYRFKKANEIIEGGYRVCFNQGINIRLIDDEGASYLSRMKFRDDSFKKKRIYTAWQHSDIYGSNDCPNASAGSSIFPDCRH